MFVDMEPGDFCFKPYEIEILSALKKQSVEFLLSLIVIEVIRSKGLEENITYRKASGST